MPKPPSISDRLASSDHPASSDRLAFSERLAASQRRTGSMLCVGLDPDPARLPDSPGPLPERVESFCRDIIEATSSYASSYKLNFAFFEAIGDRGMEVLRSVRRALPEQAISIADAKRGDIGNSARFYAASVFGDLDFDAVTVSPYMGADSVMPFLEFEGKGVYVLARTSNQGGGDFQLLSAQSRPVYEHVGRHVNEWNSSAPGEAALVVGATDLTAMKRLREVCPTLSFLVPGVGAQGGDAASVIKSAWAGPGSLAVNSSRAILYASSGPDFAAAASRAARSAAIALSLPS